MTFSILLLFIRTGWYNKVCEHLDGRGYPRGLKGEQIGLSARIICVADAYDAMVISRPYRKGLSMETALAELHRCEGTQFDERVVHALELYLKDLG